MLFPETVTNRDKELGSEAELKQPDVRLCSISKKASELADSKDELLSVEFGLIRIELLFPFLPTSRGDLFCQSLATLDSEFCTELELSSLSALVADVDVWLKPGLITLARRSRSELRCCPTSSDHVFELGMTLVFRAVMLLHAELGQRQAV